MIDLPQAVQDEIPTLINEAIRFLQREHNYLVMQAVAEYTTTELTRSAGALPSNWKEERGAPYDYPDLGTPRKLVWAPSRADAERRYGTNVEYDFGQPKAIHISDPTSEAGAATVNVYPLPDGASDHDDGEYRIKLYYWKYLADLSGDADTNWFTVNAAEFIIYKATAEAFAIDWDEERETKWLARAVAEKKSLERADKMAQIAQVEHLVPYQGVNDPRIPE